MKKTIFFIPILIVLLSGCGGEGNRKYPELREIAPRTALKLCDTKEETPFVTPDGYETSFRGSAVMIESCFTNTLWRVTEDPGYENSAIFYFNKDGRLVDVCEPSLRPKPCEKFAALTCLEANLCE